MSVAADRVVLPHGYFSADEHHRTAEVRMWTGEDEELLLEMSPSLLPVERSTALLSRCVTKLAGKKKVTPEAVCDLTVGDREALLLHVWRLSEGDLMPCVVNCPRPECREPMDVDLKPSVLLQPPVSTPRAVYKETVESNGQKITAHFRLPTGADQTAAARVAKKDSQAAAALLFERCVLTLIDERNEKAAPSQEIVSALETKMATLDPQAETILNLMCPVCGEDFSVLFDTGRHLFSAAFGLREVLYREVHLLALNYHWSETEILSMSTKKRRRYLDLLLDSFAD